MGFFPTGSPRINVISYAYIAIFVVSKCVATILQENGIEIAYMAGYDTGQYTAVHEAGGISFFDSLDLLRIYSELYMDLIRSGKYDMIKINGITSTLLPKYLDNRTAIAAYQSQTQHLVSGTREGIEAVRQKLRNASGVTIYNEGLGLGLNSSLMEQVAKHFQRYISNIELADLRIPLISNINGKQILQGAQVKEEMLHLITRPIAWDKVVDKLGQADIILGIGHLKANILDLVREKYSEKRSLGLSCEEDFEKLISIIKTFNGG